MNNQEKEESEIERKMENEFDVIEKEELEVKVSLCTPTFNRRPFLKFLIECVRKQTYSKKQMEWIVLDDGTDKVEDIFEEVATELNVKYFYSEEKMSLGKKRNRMHEHCSGDIIIYMDDDDYYPPNRVSHAVERLCANPGIMIAGSSIMNVFFPKLQTMIQFGPYGNNHATAATFAFWRKLLDITRYDEESFIAEEKTFLKNYTIPLLQLDTQKTIMVLAHDHNSFDKHTILPQSFLQACQENEGCPPVDMAKYFHGVPCVCLSSFSFCDFGVSHDMEMYYRTEMNLKLNEYPQGSVGLKPDVLRQMDKMTIFRLTKMNQMIQQQLNELQMENKRLKEINDHVKTHISKLLPETISLRKELALIKEKEKEKKEKKK